MKDPRHVPQQTGQVFHYPDPRPSSQRWAYIRHRATFLSHMEPPIPGHMTAGGRSQSSHLC